MVGRKLALWDDWICWMAPCQTLDYASHDLFLFPFPPPPPSLPLPPSLPPYLEGISVLPRGPPLSGIALPGLKPRVVSRVHDRHCVELTWKCLANAVVHA